MSRILEVIRANGLSEEASYEELFGPQLSPDPYRTHAEEIAYFRARVNEMLERLSAATCTGCVLLAHHPHFRQLQEDAGAEYNDVVQEVLAEAAAAWQVPFFEAEQDIEAMYGGRYADFFRWPEDIYSHLTPEGYLRYGAAIAAHFHPVFEAAWEAKLAERTGPEG